MNKKEFTLKYKMICVFMAFLLALLWPFSYLSVQADDKPAYDTADAVHISTAADLISFSQSCAMDTWSQGKLFVLDNDIDLSGTDFSPIPTFGGIFLGQGHCITGFTLTAGSNYTGLFRYIQKDGEVYNLSVRGVLEAESTHSGLGLIAGCNYGIISNSYADGDINGGSEAGLIVGLNETSGVITNCIASGTIYGSHLIGGIAGNNHGSITNCTNHSNVNTIASSNDINLSSIDVEATLTDILTTENAASVTDIGGIAGTNDGLIRACVNDGAVGYQHVGYNIGGIAGSQMGYIEGCINYGTLNGRKDVGGIAGQMEPSSEMEYSQDTMEKLDVEFDKLHDLLTQLDRDASGASTSLTGQVDQLLNSVEGAQYALDDILAQASNDFSSYSKLTDLTTLPSPRPVSLEFLDELPTMSPWASISPTPTATAEPGATPTIAPTPTATPESSATPEPTAAPTATPAASATPEPTAASQPAATPTATPDDGTTGARLTTLPGQEYALEEEQYLSPVLMAGHPGVLRAMTLYDDPTPGPAATAVPTATPTATPTALPGATATPTATPFLHWPDGVPTPSADLDDINWQDYYPDININREDVEKTINDTQQYVYEDASKVLSDLQSSIRGHAATISDRLSSAHNSLSSSFSSIISNMRTLNSMLDTNDQIILNDFQAIIDELNVITDLITNPDSTDPEDRYSDVSDEDQLTDTTGKVMNSVNKGKINGDVNVGGVAGAMSRENNLDPEDDLNLDSSTLNFRYKERIVVRDCENFGKVEGKKDCIGGIVGDMTLGSIIDCINNGSVTSDGSKLGGIAGSSGTIIRGSSSKCSLSGKDKIGGIAGYGTNISDCYSMIQIREGEDYLGSIAGNVDSSGEITNNYFVEGCPAGIDGISYTGKAQPISYQEFLERADLPVVFQDIVLTFEADERVVSTVTLSYGENFNASMLPQVPEKEGYIGEWADFDRNNITFDQTIEAQYVEYISTIESNETRNDRPILLAEGTFHPEDYLVMTSLSLYPEDAKTKAECCKVSIHNSYGGPYTIRYLLPEEMKHTTIELYQHGQWVPAQTQTDGSYLVFSSDKSEFVFACVDRPETINTVTILVLSCLLVILLIIVILIICQKRKLKKHKKH